MKDTLLLAVEPTVLHLLDLLLFLEEESVLVSSSLLRPPSLLMTTSGLSSERKYSRQLFLATINAALSLSLTHTM